MGASFSASAATLIAAGAALLGGLITLIVTTIRERARSREDTKRLEMRLRAEESRLLMQLRAEESRLLNTEGRAALAEFLAAATTLEEAGRVWPVRDEVAVRKAVGNLRLAVARVQVTCSVRVAGLASGMEKAAATLERSYGDDRAVQMEARLRFRERHFELVRTVRDELGLNDPKPGEERSKSWLVTGRTEHPDEEQDTANP
jgi:hypothetical protein